MLNIKTADLFVPNSVIKAGKLTLKQLQALLLGEIPRSAAQEHSFVFDVPMDDRFPASEEAQLVSDLFARSMNSYLCSDSLHAAFERFHIHPADRKLIANMPSLEDVLVDAKEMDDNEIFELFQRAKPHLDEVTLSATTLDFIKACSHDPQRHVVLGGATPYDNFGSIIGPYGEQTDIAPKIHAAIAAPVDVTTNDYGYAVGTLEVTQHTEERAQSLIDFGLILIETMREVYAPFVDSKASPFGAPDETSKYSMFYEANNDPLPLSTALACIPFGQNLMVSPAGTTTPVLGTYLSSNDGRGLRLHAVVMQDLEEMFTSGKKSGLVKMVQQFIVPDKIRPIKLEDIPSLSRLTTAANHPITSETYRTLPELARIEGSLIKYLYELELKSGFSSMVSASNRQNDIWGSTAIGGSTATGGLTSTGGELGGQTITTADVDFKMDAETDVDIRSLFRSVLHADRNREYYGDTASRSPSTPTNAIPGADQALADNIMDIGKFPINVHMIMREFPMAELVNDVKTHGELGLASADADPVKLAAEVIKEINTEAKKSITSNTSTDRRVPILSIIP